MTFFFLELLNWVIGKEILSCPLFISLSDTVKICIDMQVIVEARRSVIYTFTLYLYIYQKLEVTMLFKHLFSLLEI